jgi:hypothetical protein
MMTGSVPMECRRFVVTVAAARGGKLLVPIPFDPDRVWGAKQRHHIAGTVNGARVRAVLEPVGDGFGFTLGQKSPGARGVAVGGRVTVEIAPEGPQRDDLAEDVAAVLAAVPEAGRFSTRSQSSTAGPIYAGSTQQTPTGPTLRTHRGNGGTTQIRNRRTPLISRAPTRVWH